VIFGTKKIGTMIQMDDEFNVGGFYESTDDILIQECLSMALNSIGENYSGIDVLSHVCNVSCRTQSVAGLNIELSFSIDEEEWQCSFFKGFPPSDYLQLGQCQRI
jgi:hypothetical protein